MPRGLFLKTRGSLLLQVLISTLIIAWLSYIVTIKYFLKPTMSKKEATALKEEGFDASGYDSLINTSKKKMHHATERMSEQARQIDDMTR
ncbi:MAG: hypothetical protein WC695_04540 [Candidatus Omnitrophota bacterium]